MFKRYLGDAVYAQYDGFGLVLTVEDGIRAISTIVLEPNTYKALIEYVDWLKKTAQEAADAQT